MPPDDPSLSLSLHQSSAGDAPAGAGDYVERNLRAWQRWAREYRSEARRAWTSDELRWGLWDTPESELRLLDTLAPGSDVVELGSGSASISGWLARMGMRPVAVDFVQAQLDTADQLQRDLGVSIGLLCANAEAVPFESESFDMAISEYGASLWCEPRRWLAEAYRLLRHGALLMFITNSPVLIAATPDHGEPTDLLVRDYFSNYRLEFPGDDAVEFHLTHAQWIGLLRASGFTVEHLLEIRATLGATPRIPLVSAEWARRWPSEDIWVARKTS